MKPSRSRVFSLVSALLLGASLEAGAQGLSVSDASVAEGNLGTKNITFTVTRNGSTAAVTFDFATAASIAGPGVFPATSNVDFVSAAGSGSIPAGADGATTTVTVQVAGDTVDEENEVFELTISNLSGGMSIVDGTGVGTIVDNDNAPVVAFANVTLLEGDLGSANATFTFTLSKASERVISVQAQTGDGTAIAPQDYASNTQTLTFNPGVTSQTFDVAVAGDAIDEFNETFAVTLSSPVNVSVPTATRQGTIQDNDALPSLSIDDLAFAEGDAGTTPAAFTVTLSSASEKVVTFEYVTADNSATAASGDYLAAGPTILVFNPGDPLTKSINIAVNGDAGNEGDETFRVVLSAVTGTPANAAFADSTGVATIQNDDALPDMSIGDVLVTEGTGGSTNAVFHITLSAASGRNVTVRASLAPGDTQAADYTNPGSQVITFVPGETDKVYVVPVVGDALDEYDEYFVVNLTNVANANLLNSSAYGDIDDDDDEPELSIGDASVIEGNSGTGLMTFTVTLSAPSGKTVEVIAVTSDFSCLLYTSPSPRDGLLSRMPSSA